MWCPPQLLSVHNMYASSCTSSCTQPDSQHNCLSANVQQSLAVQDQWNGMEHWHGYNFNAKTSYFIDSCTELSAGVPRRAKEATLVLYYGIG